MNIKGQNLRAFIDGRCVAAASSCDVHLAAQIEDVTDKDTEDGFTRHECVSKSWDASVQSFVTNLGDDVRDVELDDQQPVYYDLNAGDTLVVLDAANGAACVLDEDEQPLVIGDGYCVYAADEDIRVIPWSAGAESGTITVGVFNKAMGLLSLLQAIRNGEKVDFKFAFADGTDNRDLDSVLLSGKAFITDITITSANRQRVTMNAKLTGVGELDLAE